MQESNNIIKLKSKPYIAFLITGQGCIYNKMGSQLYESEQVFKESMDQIDNILKVKYYGYSMLKKFRNLNDNDGEDLKDQHLTHSMLFMFEVSLFKLFIHYNITPDLILGISLGEIASFYCSGMVDLETACFILYSRACGIQKTIKNNFDSSIIVVQMTAEKFKEKYGSIFPKLEVASYLTSSSILLGGKNKDLEQITIEFKKDNIFFGQTKLPASFHTSSMDQIKHEIIQCKFQSKLPSIQILSSVNCKFFNENENNLDSNYLFNNIRQPVSLTQSVEKLCSHFDQLNNFESIVVIEISPTGSLLQFVLSTINSITYNNHNNTKYLAPLIKNENEVLTFKNTINNIINSC